MEVVDLDLLFQIPQEYARIIGGKGEEASSRGPTMVVKNVLKNPRKLLGRSPFYSPLGNMTVGARSEKIEDSRYESRLYRVLVPSFSV